MPLYDIRCNTTGRIFERMIPLTEFAEPIVCACHSPASRLISRPMFVVEQVGYTCPVTDKWIGSKAAHRENLARQGCRVLETGETAGYMQSKAAEEAKFDKAIEDTVEREIEAMSSDKKEALHNELVNGKVDLALTRS